MVAERTPSREQGKEGECLVRSLQSAVQGQSQKALRLSSCLGLQTTDCRLTATPLYSPTC